MTGQLHVPVILPPVAELQYPRP